MPSLPTLQVTHSRGFAEWLHRQRVSLAFTTYQSNRLFLVGLKPSGQVAVLERYFDRAMGLWATPEHLLLATRYQIVRFANGLAPGERYREHDRLYLPRQIQVTGDLDIHDLGLDRDGRLVFVNTLYSCLATTCGEDSFRSLWRPPFISRLVPEDRCHLNGLALVAGRPRYVTAVARSNVAAGWRAQRANGGLVFDLEADGVVAEGLSMPHSPRWHQERLWLLNAGSGELGFIDPASGCFEPVAFCPGFLRGLTFHGDHALVGLSRIRDNAAFAGLALEQRLRDQGAVSECGLRIIDLRSGHVPEWLALEGAVHELYDVQVLPGVRHPHLLGFKADTVARMITFREGDRRCLHTRGLDGPCPLPAENGPRDSGP